MRCAGGRRGWLCVPGMLSVRSEGRPGWGAGARPWKAPEAVLRNVMCPEQWERKMIQPSKQAGNSVASREVAHGC